MTKCDLTVKAHHLSMPISMQNPETIKRSELLLDGTKEYINAIKNGILNYTIFFPDSPEKERLEKYVNRLATKIFNEINSLQEQKCYISYDNMESQTKSLTQKFNEKVEGFIKGTENYDTLREKIDATVKAINDKISHSFEKFNQICEE